VRGSVSRVSFSATDGASRTGLTCPR
jgi:hypothetical protein